MANPKKPKNQINIELKEDVAQGIYSNLAIISHSNTEFVIDFIRVVPGIPKAQVKSRIILTPEHAKRLMNALDDNVTKFEENHGPIKDLNPNNTPIMPMNFGGPPVQA